VKKKLFWVAVIAVAVGVPSFVAGQAQEKPPPFTGPDYLYIEEFEIANTVSMNDAIAEATKWVGMYRKSGEFKSVRLFMHNTGPELAAYILIEPNDWQSLETGFQKTFAANPELLSEPIGWVSGHSDNLLSEITVE